MSAEPREVADVSYDFSGRVVVITGGGRGQGRSHALGFAKAGADVVIADIGEPMETIPYELVNSDQLNAVAAEIEALGVRCQAAICDVRDAKQVQTMVDDAIKEFGRIDVLINNAGVESLPSVQEMTEEAWDAMIDTMMKGTFLCSKAVCADMLARGEGGRIITTGSANSSLGLPRQAHYVAAKHGVLGFSRALALEVAEDGITVNTVCPGAVDSPMVEGLFEAGEGEWLERLSEVIGTTNVITPGEMLNCQEITSAMLWLASDAAKFVTGSSMAVDAGFTIK